MKVLNLQCGHGHGFEGWFASDDDFLAQNAAQRIECPLCANAEITKLPSAPRLNLGARQVERVEDQGVPAAAAAETVETTGQAAGSQTSTHDRQEAKARWQSQWLQVVQHVLAHTEDVGEQFASEARRMHYGDTQARGIRGQATHEERLALEDEGIEVASLPLPAAIKGPVQ
jgi:hypothetical protein